MPEIRHLFSYNRILTYNFSLFIRGFVLLSIITAILLRIISNPLGNVIQKQLSQNNVSSLVINFVSYFLLSIFCLLFAFNINWHNLSNSFWFYSVLGGLFGAFGNAFLIKAIQNGELSILGPINSYKSVVGVIFGILLLNEIPGLTGILGIFLIIAGSYFIFDTLQEKFSFSIFARKDILFRILALIFTAIEAVFIKKIIIESSILTSFIIWCWFGAIFSFMILIFSGFKLLRQVKLSHTPNYLFLILCIGVMQFSTNYAFNKMNVGYALALFQLSSLVSVILGYKIFNEKNIRQKLIGGTIMIIGSVIIILT